jgi:hypothetical protein
VGTGHFANGGGSHYYAGGGGRVWGGPRYYGGPGYYDYYGWGIRPWGYYGYGYYPVYGGPVVAEEVPVQPPEITSAVYLGGMITNSGPGLDLRGQVDGRNWGLNFNLVALPSVDPNDSANFTIYPLLNAHLTYSVISTLQARVRLEAGASAVFAPDVTYFGPDIGASGQVALLGPFGVEGSVHWTPVPANIFDAEADLALHFGNLAVLGGWRVMRLDDSRVNDQGGVDWLTGPHVSLGLVF